jgi:tRNA(fMet)-specific endonuclease VapC
MPATGKVVLDTSVVIAHLRGIQTVTLQLEQFDTLYLPLIVLGELLHGIRKSNRSQENLAGLRRWLRASTLISLTEATADHYATIKGNLARSGTPIPENDIWIAAHAKELGLSLATRDAHFERIESLQILKW